MAKLNDRRVGPARGCGRKKAAGKPKRRKHSRSAARSASHHGLAHIHASFNNTTITITDPEGAVIAWSSAAASASRDRARGRRRATQAAIAAGNRGEGFGMRSLEVRVKGPGAGRESAIRALQTIGGST